MQHSLLILRIPSRPRGLNLSTTSFTRAIRLGYISSKWCPDGELIRLDHTREIDVKVMMITAFTEKHRSTEWWTKTPHLSKLNAKTQMNGKEVDMTGQISPQGFVFKVGDQEEVAPFDAVTLASYWVADAPRHPVVIDVSQGKLLKTTSKKLPDGSIELTGDGFQGKFTYEGDFLLVGELTRNGNTVVYKKSPGN
ncbi:DUF6134 family protein [Polynucleobacter necessarius]|uniref:DUF6134 family protein n=1 Tax=Polynucleobacter necessarius TaxID=576610 RepID=UPI0022B254EE|nr:DUF6134 family protein [Polynucleobacter necessarius]